MLLPSAALFALLATGPASPCDEAAWLPLIRSHMTRYPAWELQDAYKLLHQAALGSEHAVPDPETPRRWLRRELAELGDGPTEPIVDTIGAFVRIHLRPFVAAGGDPSRLLEAFVATANTPTELTTLECALNALQSRVQRGDLPWSADSVGDWLRGKRNAGYPAVSHGDAFSRAYAPAYRVIRMDLVARVLPNPD